MRYRSRRITAAVLVFSLFFQLLPLPAFAGGGKRPPLPVAEPASARHASLNTNVFSPRPVRPAAAPSITAAVTAPSDMGVVTAPTEVVGTAAAEGLTRYTLAYAPVQKRNEGDPEYKPVEYVTFATGTQPVSGGVLGVGLDHSQEKGHANRRNQGEAEFCFLNKSSFSSGERLPLAE